MSYGKVNWENAVALIFLNHLNLDRMKQEKTFREKVQERLEKWKGELEELQLQLNLGSKEAQDSFEEQKKYFRDWIEKNRHRIDEIEDEIGDEGNNLREKLKDLNITLEKGKAETEEAFSEQKQRISKLMQQFRERLSEVGDGGSEKVKNLMEDWDEDITKFRTRLDLLALQFRLGMKEAGVEMEEIRAEAREKLAELKKKIAASSEESGEMWETVRGDVKDAFNRLTGLFQEKDKDKDSGEA